MVHDINFSLKVLNFLFLYTGFYCNQRFVVFTLVFFYQLKVSSFPHSRQQGLMFVVESGLTST